MNAARTSYAPGERFDNSAVPEIFVMLPFGVLTRVT
jgi:hypothetical protein